MKIRKKNILKGIKTLFLMVILSVMNEGAANALIERYVDASASGTFTGTQADPFQSIHQACQWANGETTIDAYVIYIKAGTYSPGSPEPLSDGTYSISNFDATSITIVGDKTGGTVLDGNTSASWTTGLTVEAQSIEIKNLTVTDFSGDGLVIRPVSGYPMTGIVSGNTISNVTNGVYIDAQSASASVDISSNRISNVTNGIYGVTYNFTISTFITNNVIYDIVGISNANGISLDNMSTGGGGLDTKIYFNTIDSGGNANAKGVFLTAGNSGDPFSAEVSFNNITGFTATGSGIDASNANLSLNPTTVRYNNFWNTDTTFTNCTLSDNLSPAQDPQYSSDFSIPATSPCINRIPESVVSLIDPIVENDIINTPRPRAPVLGGTEDYDIGAYEYYVPETFILYVDTDGGNNGNDGKTVATAWETLTYALSSLNGARWADGDSIVLYLQPGIYSTGTGEASSAHEVTVSDIAIKGNGSNVIIDGQSGGVWDTGLTINGDYVTLTELTFRNFAKGIGIGSCYSTKVLNCRIESSDIGIDVMPTVDSKNATPIISGCTITGYNNYGIQFYDTATAGVNGTITDNTLSSSEPGVDMDIVEGINLISNYDISASIERNQITYSGPGISIGIKGYGAGGTLTTGIRQNRFTGMASAIDIKGSSGTLIPYILNNVISASSFDAGYKPDILADIYVAVPTTGFCTADIYHNTLDGASTAEKGIYISGSVEGSITGKISFNIATNYTVSGFENDSTYPVVFGSGTFEYNNAYGNGTNYTNISITSSSMEVDPKYASDLSIPQDSPCVDKIPLSAYSGISELYSLAERDALGDIISTSRLRPASASGSAESDIGAYEYPYMSYDFTMPAGTTGTAQDYKIRTLPIDLSGGDIQAAFENLYGIYDTTLWRIFAYDGSAGQYIELSSDSFNSLALRGRAFWAISTDSAFSDPVRTFEGNLIGNTQPFTMELSQGWNLIALPWSAPVASHSNYLSGLIVQGDFEAYSLTSPDQTLTDPILWSYDPENAAAGEDGYVRLINGDDTLAVGTGYWLNVNAASVKLTIPLPESTMQKRIGKKSRKDVSLYEAPPAPPSSERLTAEGGNGCFVHTAATTPWAGSIRFLMLFILSGALLFFRND